MSTDQPSLKFYQTMKKLKLNDQPVWTISDAEKHPMDPTQGLKYHFDPERYNPEAYYRGDKSYWGNMAENPNECLVTLDQLFDEPNTPLQAFALHANIDKQHVILLDLEAEYDKSIKPYLKKLPFIYGEKSRHGGLHFLVPVSDDLLNDPKYQDLFQSSNKKIGTTTDKHTGLELFFHNHYLTFTENQVPIKNNNTEQDLREFLDWMLNKISTAQVDHKNYVNYNGKQDRESFLAQIPYDALNIAQHSLSNVQMRRIKKISEKYNDPNYTGTKNHPLEDTSQSHRDYLIIFEIARELLTAMSKEYAGAAKPMTKNDQQFMEDINAGYQLDTLIWTIAEFAVGDEYGFLKERPKLYRYIASQKQTYLQYIINTAINYLLAGKQGPKYKAAMKQHPKLLQDA